MVCFDACGVRASLLPVSPSYPPNYTGAHSREFGGSEAPMHMLHRNQQEHLRGLQATLEAFGVSQLSLSLCLSLSLSLSLAPFRSLAPCLPRSSLLSPCVPLCRPHVHLHLRLVCVHFI